VAASKSYSEVSGYTGCRRSTGTIPGDSALGHRRPRRRRRRLRPACGVDRSGHTALTQSTQCCRPDPNTDRKCWPTGNGARGHADVITRQRRRAVDVLLVVSSTAECALLHTGTHTHTHTHTPCNNGSSGRSCSRRQHRYSVLTTQ